MQAVVSTLSHELRSPMAIVKAALANLREEVGGTLTDTQATWVATAERQCDRLLRLIQNHLEFSRLTSGRVRLTRTRVSLSPLLEQVRDDFQHQAKARGLELTLELEEDLPEIEADPDSLVQVLHNLIGNALRFASAQVRIEACRDMGEVRLSVCDDGPGIDPLRAAMLFDHYTQLARQADVDGYKGTGLGLAIAREIVNLHDGRLWVESIPGAGARFHCVFPAVVELVAPPPPVNPVVPAPFATAEGF